MKHSLWIALVYAVLSCALVANARAGTEDLLTVSSDQTTVKHTEVEAIVDADGDVTGMTVFGKTYSLQELHEGAVVFAKHGFSVLILQGDIDPNTETGSFRLKFLKQFSVFGSTYGSCPFKARREANRGNWYIQNAYTGQRVHEINVIANSNGIQTLQNICN